MSSAGESWYSSDLILVQRIDRQAWDISIRLIITIAYILHINLL